MAVNTSVIQNAFHTPSGPIKRDRRYAVGMINDHVAEKRNNKGLGTFSKAFQAPEAVTDTAETRKPALMIFRALEPAAMVSG